jgi:hypothetical protein
MKRNPLAAVVDAIGANADTGIVAGSVENSHPAGFKPVLLIVQLPAVEKSSSHKMVAFSAAVAGFGVVFLIVPTMAEFFFAKGATFELFTWAVKLPIAKRPRKLT